MGELSTLYQKAKAYNAGHRVIVEGKEFLSLYTPRNQKLIDLFGITDDEQRQLRTIITRKLAAERHAEREKARRRAAGAVDRAEYLKTAEGRREQAQELRKEGMSYAKIAKALNVSKSEAYRLLS